VNGTTPRECGLESRCRVSEATPALFVTRGLPSNRNAMPRRAGTVWMVIVTGKVGLGPDAGPGGGVWGRTGGGAPVPVGLGCGLGPVVGGGGEVGDGVGDRVGGGVGGGVDGGGVGVGADAGPGAADTADLAALGQASTMVSEMAADTIIMIAPSPVRRTDISRDCPLGSARR
jgi:hypothetical protein